MRRFIDLFVFLLFLSIVSSCATRTQMSISKSADVFAVETIALMPGGGILSDAIGVELLNFGFTIIDTTSVSSIMIRNNLNEAEIMLPTNLLKLKEQGIDSVLNVRTVAGYDGKPQSATFRLVSTERGSIIVGGSWNNAAFGAQGSPADAAARRDLSTVAREIANGLARALGK